MDDCTIDQHFSPRPWRRNEEDVLLHLKSYKFRYTCKYDLNLMLLIARLTDQFGLYYDWQNHAGLKAKWTTFNYRNLEATMISCFLFREEDDFIFFKLMI